MDELTPTVGVRAAGDAVGGAGWLPPATAPRRRADPAGTRAACSAGSAAGLTAAEILAELHSDRFVNTAPAEVWATLLDEGHYLGSVSTFYRLLRATR